jgi:hypothetical protein
MDWRSLARRVISFRGDPASTSSSWRRRVTIARKRVRSSADTGWRVAQISSGDGPVGPRGRAVAFASARAVGWPGQLCRLPSQVFPARE